MRKTAKFAVAALSLAVIAGGAGLLPATGYATEADRIAEGKKLSFDRKLGNCLACHMMGDGVSPGDIGPPLIAMKARYPDRDKLRMQIWDATVANPNSRMPPFGSHGILTEEQVDLITDYVHTL